ncbi:class I SAM-dependent methyltransferase (plasmid) [Weissella confusa]|uniref:class I SAM-dependent methyltransferase n=1 Tax=Weissella confusa TaxID=1583 RepID=UPI001C6F6BC7|nr:methyltransferase domain-containing protein [Weissella confusa]QYU58990.1 class I SAM-dependent methyltransferase [Weissella confusa]QYU59003.1 class I SAM-dependent methyltransferase [Weissella confusa]
MINKTDIFPGFLNAHQDKQFVELYSNEKFARIYHEMILQDKLPDIDYFLSELKDDGQILEIGSGTGRVMSRLLDAGFDIYGIEPSRQMIDKMSSNQLRDRVFEVGVDDITFAIKKLNNLKTIIIPATTISLFSSDTLNRFLEALPDNVEIHFDYMTADFFVDMDRKVSVYHSADGEKLFYVNFIVGNKVVYNITDGNVIAFSDKYLYTYKMLSDLFSKNHINLQVTMEQKNRYQMLRGTKNV